MSGHNDFLCSIDTMTDMSAFVFALEYLARGCGMSYDTMKLCLIPHIVKI